MNDLTCIILGGGYVGLAALKAIKEKTKRMTKGRRIRIVLIDKEPGHLRKFRLFRPTAVEEEIMIPWNDLVLDGFEFLQGTVTSVDSSEKLLRYSDAQGNDAQIHYDILVVAVGSIVRRPEPNQGGVALIDPQAASECRKCWLANLRNASHETDPIERKRLTTIAIVGAGISGIETSAELALAMKKEAAALGLDSHDISVYLLNSQEHLLPEVSKKFRRKLVQELGKCGVTVLNNRKVLREEAGEILFSDGGSLPVGISIWMIGLIPNPALQSMGLPLTSDGRVQVDGSYRVKGAPGVYSIGDCARIVDPKTGEEDQMTCFEGSLQAFRLAKIVMADLDGRSAPIHQSGKPKMDNYFNIGLGEKGVFWIRKWGIEMVMSGKIPGKIKKWVEDKASMLR